MATHILVVDDETAIADLVEVYLKNEGFTIHKFYNASDALACVRTTRLDLAVLDVNLGHEDSLPVARALLARGVHFVFATGYGADLELPAEFAGVPEVDKPYQLEDVLRKLRRPA